MSHRRRRRQRGGLPPIFMLPVALILGLIVLVVVFGGVVSLLGGLAMTGLLCFAPLLIIGLAIAAIARSEEQKAGASASTGAWTRPQQAATARSTTLAADASAGAAPARPAAASIAARPLVQPLDPYPDKNARPADEYRRRAAEYRKQIQGLIKGRRAGLLADRLKDVLQKLTSWEERVGQLADRLTSYERDGILRRDFKEVPDRINRLRRQAALETDPEMCAQIARTAGAYEEQYRQLETLARLMRRTRLNLDDTLAAMGTIYSQTQVLNAMDIDSARAARIAEEIDAEVLRLNDVLSALSEAYQGTGSAASPEAAEGEEQTEDIVARKARLSSDNRSAP